MKTARFQRIFFFGAPIFWVALVLFYPWKGFGYHDNLFSIIDTAALLLLLALPIVCILADMLLLYILKEFEIGKEREMRRRAGLSLILWIAVIAFVLLIPHIL